MSNSLIWFKPIMIKALIEGLVLGFKMIWMVIKTMPWPMYLLLTLGIITNLMASGRRHKRFN